MSVVLINPFEVPAGKEEDFLAAWKGVADYMREQPGFIAAKLHRSLAADATFRFVNVAEWESPRHFQAAVTNPEFGKLAEGAPPSHPSLYEVVDTM